MMNVSYFEDDEFGIKGVTKEDIELVKSICDNDGRVPSSGSLLEEYKYQRFFSDEEWLMHTKNCDNIVREILERVKFLPDKIEHFDWWEMDSDK
jgi:hypothetical protein